MGISSDAILALGIPLDDYFVLPWNEESEHYDDDESWWRHINGFKYTETDWNKKYDEEKEWGKTHPMPFEVVRHCSDSYTMYFLAVPGTVSRASRGYPVELDVDYLHKKVDLDAIGSFVKFVKDHNISNDTVVKWFLMSYMG